MPQPKSKLSIVVLAFVNLALSLASNGLRLFPFISDGSTPETMFFVDVGHRIS